MPYVSSLSFPCILIKWSARKKTETKQTQKKEKKRVFGNCVEKNNGLCVGPQKVQRHMPKQAKPPSSKVTAGKTSALLKPKLGVKKKEKKAVQPPEETSFQKAKRKLEAKLFHPTGGKKKKKKNIVCYASSDGRYKDKEKSKPTFGAKSGLYRIYRGIKSHRITKYAFHRGPAVDSGDIFTVDHEDGDPQNGRIDNLRYATRSQQNEYSHELNPSAKWGPEGKKIIAWRADKNGNRIGEGIEVGTRKDAPAILKNDKVTRSGIGHVLGGQLKTHAGYTFAYAPIPNLPGEIWKNARCDGKKIPRTKASNMGRIKIKDEKGTGERVTCGSLTSGGYRTVSVDGVPYQVHRVIACTFLRKNKDFSLTVNHINHTRDDNRLENLEWATCEEQSAKKLQPAAVSAKITAEKTSTKVRARKLGSEGEWMVFKSARDAAHDLGIIAKKRFDSTQILNVCNPREKLSKHKGYVFEYAEPEKFKNFRGERWVALDTDDLIKIRALAPPKSERRKRCCKTVIIRRFNSPKKILTTCDDVPSAIAYLQKRCPSVIISDGRIRTACKSGKNYHGFLVSYGKRETNREVSEEESVESEEGEESAKEESADENEEEESTKEESEEEGDDENEFKTIEDMDREIDEIYAEDANTHGKNKKKRRAPEETKQNKKRRV